ncbi:hypothetical protein Ddc_18522 [Ditylenchus destructor]|nr:hypothetical protein Ddc_18522 [Ditylenchus destructor]
MSGRPLLLLECSRSPEGFWLHLGITSRASLRLGRLYKFKRATRHSPRCGEAQWLSAVVERRGRALLEPSRSICGRPHLVFLEAQTEGYPTPPRSPRSECRLEKAKVVSRTWFSWKPRPWAIQRHQDRPNPSADWKVGPKSSQMPSGLLEASRSKGRQPDLVFLEAQTVGYPTTPRSPQSECRLESWPQIQPNALRASRSF